LCVVQIVTVSLRHADVVYADGMAAKDKVSRSEVMRRALRSLKWERHDMRTPMQRLLFLADAFGRGMVNRHEAAGTIRELVKAMDPMRASAERSPRGSGGWL